MADLSIQDLLEAGVHFGHQTRRWNPKMKKFIFTERNGIYIIDLQKTLMLLNRAREAVRQTAERGQSVLFVGTKPQASAIFKEAAEKTGQFYVTNRWFGGTLTNFKTTRQSIKRLEHLEQMASDGTFEHLTKKEILNIEKQRDRLVFVLGGIRNMTRLPGMLVVVDTKKEKIAVNEANRLGIPVCAILDTNCDPDLATYPIPANDDAIRSIEILTIALADSLQEGLQRYFDEEGAAEKEKAVKEAEEVEEEVKKKGRKAVSTQSEDSETPVASEESEKKDEKPAKKGPRQETGDKNPRRRPGKKVE